MTDLHAEDRSAPMRRESPGALSDAALSKPWIVVGLSVIALSVIVAAAVDSGTIAIVFAAISSCTLVGTIFMVWITHREDRIRRRYAELQNSRDNWASRWHALDAEFRQTATAMTKLTDGVIVLSSEGRILLINPPARRLLTLGESDELIGRVFAEVVRMPDINHLVSEARVNTKSQVGMVDVTEGTLVRPLRVNVNPIGSDTHSEPPSNLLLILRDETETRRVEEMRREFVANVSHELKTPLAAIKGYAETVEMAIEDDPDAASHFMGQLQMQCLRLERLVEDMMQLARAQAGTHNMTLVRLPLDEVIADAMKSCQPIADSKQIDLTVLDGQDDSVVIADREATLTIANNLISNAVRYTPEGGHVRVRTERHGEFVALVVEDNGVGIPEEEQDRIFQRFYRVDRNRQSGGGGTGIGLSIVKNLTLAQSGEIRLSSTPGKGSTFRVLLPAVEVAADNSPSPHAEFIKPSSPGST